MIFILLAAALVASCEVDKAPAQMEWQPPAFQLMAASGEMLHYPEDLDGPTIVLFWASWCPYCKALMPHLQSIVDEYDGAVRVLAFNFRDDDDPAGLLARQGYDFELILNSEEVAEQWGVKATPGLFLADANGRVVFSQQSIPRDAYPQEQQSGQEKLSNSLKAARRAPFWAAELRKAIDHLAR